MSVYLMRTNQPGHSGTVSLDSPLKRVIFGRSRYSSRLSIFQLISTSIATPGHQLHRIASGLKKHQSGYTGRVLTRTYKRSTL